MQKVMQFGRYGSVAIGSAVTDYAVFSIGFFLGAGIIPSQMVARISGGLFSFFANRFWSFKAHNHRHIAVAGYRFLLLYAISFTINLAIVYVLALRLGISAFPAKITADVSCFVLNFFVMKYYVFAGNSLGNAVPSDGADTLGEPS